MKKRSFQPRPYYRESRRKSTMMVGILVGVVIGVATVVGIAIYFNYASTPFTNLNRLSDQATTRKIASEPLESLSPDAAMVTSANRSASQPIDIASSRPKNTQPKTTTEFDFYKILPGKLAVGSNGRSNPQQSASHKKHNYLQLGSFQNAGEANNLKAKLALVGINVHIQSIAVPSKGLVHRVLIGPIRTDSIEPMRILLRQNHVHSAIVIVQ